MLEPERELAAYAGTGRAAQRGAKYDMADGSLRSSWRSATLAAGVGLLLAGCGTSTSNVPAQRQSQASVSQQVGIDTPGVPGAQCTLSSVTVGRQTVTTPGSIEVDRSPEIIVVLCRKPCFLDTSAMITPEGLRKPDGTVIYGYPAETALTMRPAKSCDATASRAGGGAAP